MNEPINFHRPQRDNGITSASSHPQLKCGEFAVPPRRHVSIMALDRSVTYDRRRAIGGTLAMAVIMLLLLGVALRSGAAADSDADPQQFARATCLIWAQAASAVVSRQVQSTRDVDLVSVVAAIDRLRRARRNCELGELAEACKDYHAVVSSVPGRAISNDFYDCTHIVANATK